MEGQEQNPLLKKFNKEDKKRLRKEKDAQYARRLQLAKINVRKTKQEEAKLIKENQLDNEKKPVKHVTTVEKTKKSIEIFLAEQKLPNYVITEVDFSVMSRETISKLNVCEINDLNTKIDRYNTLEDPRSGTSENWSLCGCCEKTTEECAGHLGWIDLLFDFIHPLYRNITVHVLQCICMTCNKLLISERVIEDEGFSVLRGLDRLKKIAECCKKLNCANPNCAPNVIFKTSLPDDQLKKRSLPIIVNKGKNEELQYLHVSKIKKILNSISDKDASLLGFNTKNNHPRNFVMDFIPVIPITDRPPNINDSEKKDHALTVFYEFILQTFLQYNSFTDENQKEESAEDIIDFFHHLVKNKGEMKKHPSDTLSSITDQIKKKTGLIRGNIMGKRCDYTGRTPLGPNRKLSFGYIAPSFQFQKMTIPEVITKYNYNRVLRLAEEGKIQFLCPREGNLAGRKLRFNLMKHKDKLVIGDRIDRCSENGDVFIFNRQPTLHRHSMLGYIADFQDKYSIGIHLSSTEGHNADFDGDEGNLHLVQTVPAQVEARLVMSALNCMISASQSFPKAKIIYNSLTGGYLLSDDRVILTKEEFEEALDLVFSYSKTSYARDNYESLKDRLDDIHPYSGKALCSILFPPDFWFLDSTGVFITKGVLRRGRLKKSSLNGSSKDGKPSVIQNIWKWYGKEMAGEFITVSNFLFNWYIMKYGFSLGIDDCMLGDNQQIFDQLRKKEIEKMNDKLMDLALSGDNISEEENTERENSITEIVTKTSSILADQVEGLVKENKTNSLLIMAESGGKGGKKNTANVIGSVGQNFVNQALPKMTISDNKRWLSTFSIHDRRAESRGFSANSYFEGLDCDEYFAQAQSGRIGLMDTAVKTQDIGYMQRRMVKAQEDLIIQYDGSIRNQRGVIFQFSYGPGLNTQNMVLDDSDDGFHVYSFIKIKELCGRINNFSGFTEFDITTAMQNIIINHGGYFETKVMVEEEEEENKLGFDQEFEDYDNEE